LSKSLCTASQKLVKFKETLNSAGQSYPSILSYPAASAVTTQQKRKEIVLAKVYMPAKQQPLLRLTLQSVVPGLAGFPSVDQALMPAGTTSTITGAVLNSFKEGSCGRQQSCVAVSSLPVPLGQTLMKDAIGASTPAQCSRDRLT